MPFVSFGKPKRGLEYAAEFTNCWEKLAPTQRHFDTSLAQ
ncbi:MAG: hypothetical protein ACI9HY_001631 [Planctomycetaceae bacterium]|jgi:hypothetical protein